MNMEEEIRKIKEEERAYLKEGDLERAGHSRGVANTLIAMLWNK